jgi:hypothetical protein
MVSMTADEWQGWLDLREAPAMGTWTINAILSLLIACLLALFIARTPPYVAAFITLIAGINLITSVAFDEYRSRNAAYWTTTHR